MFRRKTFQHEYYNQLKTTTRLQVFPRYYASSIDLYSIISIENIETWQRFYLTKCCFCPKNAFKILDSFRISRQQTGGANGNFVKYQETPNPIRGGNTSKCCKASELPKLLHDSSGIPAWVARFGTLQPGMECCGFGFWHGFRQSVEERYSLHAPAHRQRATRTTEAAA